MYFRGMRQGYDFAPAKVGVKLAQANKVISYNWLNCSQSYIYSYILYAPAPIFMEYHHYHAVASVASLTRI